MFVFLNKQRLVVNVWNRSGAAKSANNIVNFFNETFARIKNKIALKGIVADAGFYNEVFIKLLENLGLRYIIKAALYNNLAGQIRMISKEKWIVVDKGIWVSELYFKPDARDKERRYIVVRQQKDIKENALGKALPLFENIDMNDYLYSVMATNIFCLPAVEIWSQQRSRSNDENIIKELKEDFSNAGFGLNRFLASLNRLFIKDSRFE
ncbi:MAG TPA: transposase [bacterium]|nr:transposase [bacterium]